MRIDLAVWLATGTIAPLNWGISLESFFSIWPAARAEIEEQLLLGYPFVTLDDVEFYFEGNEFTHLSEVVIKAWCIDGKQLPVYFLYGWIRQNLSYTRVKGYLEAAGLAFSVQYGSSGTPDLRTSTGVVLAFYSELNYNQGEEIELAKIYLSNHLLV